MPLPEVTHPEVTCPEATHPEVTHPEVTCPEVTHPEVTRPEVTHPEVACQTGGPCFKAGYSRAFSEEGSPACFLCCQAR